MHTVIVTFPLSDTGRDEAFAAFRDSAPSYRRVPGLIRKYYLYDGDTGGGVYLFEDAASVEAAFDEAWRARIRERYGVEPELRIFETPLIVDNQVGAIEDGAG